MFNKDDEEKRFIKILKESSVTQTIEIILDTETGVNYMYVTGVRERPSLPSLIVREKFLFPVKEK